MHGGPHAHSGRNPQGGASSWDHRLIFPPPPAATPEPALSEALQGGDRVTRLSASGRAIASGGAPSPAKVLVVLTMGALRPLRQPLWRGRDLVWTLDHEGPIRAGQAGWLRQTFMGHQASSFIEV